MIKIIKLPKIVYVLIIYDIKTYQNNKNKKVV